MSGRWSMQGWAFRPWAFATWSLAGPTNIAPPHPNGGDGLWYAQPNAGIDYPLVKPSEDIRYLLADFYLSYTNPADYGSTDFVRPFRIKWLYGFGLSEPQESVTLPEPVHDLDIIVVDANEAVVFDSRDADFSTRDWTDWLAITTFKLPTSESYLSVVHRTATAEADFPPAKPYPISFFPEDAKLQEYTCVSICKRVRSISALLSSIEAKPVMLRGGYNLSIDSEVLIASAGGRKKTTLTFNAVPGAGDGLYPDCTPSDLPIRTINQLGPNAAGNFFLNAAGCYYIRQPVTVISEQPRLAVPNTQLVPGSNTESNLPADNAGTTILAAGWPEDDRYAHLKVGNDCKACCDCDDYVEMAQQTRIQHAVYRDISNRVKAAHNVYRQARSAWLTAKECLRSSGVRAAVVAQACPTADIAVQVCNQTDSCMVDIEIRTAISSVPADVVPRVLPGYTYMTAPFVVEGIQRVTTKRWIVEVVDDEGLVIIATIDQLTPGSSGVIRFRVAFDDCGGTSEGGEPYQVIASATAKAGSAFLNTTPATATAVLNCPAEITAPDSNCVTC